MWVKFINFILLLLFGYEDNNEFLTEETIEQPFLINKKKIICIILILIFCWWYYYGIPSFFLTKDLEINLWTQLKNYTNIETFNKISDHIQNIYENPYYRQKELNCLRFIQWTNCLKNTENSDELNKCIETLINQIENEFKDVPKYTSYK